MKNIFKISNDALNELLYFGKVFLCIENVKIFLTFSEVDNLRFGFVLFVPGCSIQSSFMRLFFSENSVLTSISSRKIFKL